MASVLLINSKSFYWQTWASSKGKHTPIYAHRNTHRHIWQNACCSNMHKVTHTCMHARMHTHTYTHSHPHTHTHKKHNFYHYQQHDQHQTLKTNQKQTISMQTLLVRGRSWFTLLAISKTTPLNINKINMITSLHSGKNKLRSETAQLVYTALLKQASNFYLEIKLHNIQFNHNLSQLC